MIYLPLKMMSQNLPFSQWVLGRTVRHYRQYFNEPDFRNKYAPNDFLVVMSDYKTSTVLTGPASIILTGCR